MAIKNIIFAANSSFADQLVAFEAEKLSKKGLGNGKEVTPEKKAPALLAPVSVPVVDTFDFSAFVRPELDEQLEASKGLLAQARKEREAGFAKKEAARLAEIEAEKKASAAKREAGFAVQRAVAACTWEKAARKAGRLVVQAESLRSGAVALANQVSNVNGRVNALKAKAQTKGLTSAEAQQGAALMTELAKVSAEANTAKVAFDNALAGAKGAQETAMTLFSFDARKGVDCFADQLLEAQQLGGAERLLDLAVHFGQSAEFAGLSNLLGAVRACRNSGKEWVRKDLKGQVVEAVEGAVVAAKVVVVPVKGAKPSLTTEEIADLEAVAQEAAEEKKAAELPKLLAAVEAAKAAVAAAELHAENCRKQLDALGGPAKVIGSGKNARREIIAGARVKASATWKSSQERAEAAVADLRRAEKKLAR